MKIFLTGGTGFLGPHIVKLLSLDQHQVCSPSSSGVNLLNKDETCRMVKSFKPDVILHAAAICAGILGNKNSPADFLHKNLDMGSNIFHAAKESGCTRVYTLGSVCSYPSHSPTPFQENNIWNGYPESTNAPYGIAKRVLMLLGQTYREQYGFTGAHLIPVNLYGPGDHFKNEAKSHVIPALIKKFDDAILNSSPEVECWGTGKISREFLYVEDAAQAISKAVLTGFDSDLPINLGSGTNITIKKLACLISSLTGYSGDIVFNGQVSDGQQERLLDVSRAKDLLGWTASTSFRSGLIKTIEWYRMNK